jgi:hypothetical protein
MLRQVLFRVRGQDSERWTFRSGELFCQLREFPLIESQDDIAIRDGDRHALLTADANHLHRRLVVLGDVFLDEGNLVSAKELLSSITPWSGVRRVNGDLWRRVRHQYPLYSEAGRSRSSI